MEIIWSGFEEKQLELIFQYYKEKASKKVANNLLRDIINEPDRLKRDPFLGQEEGLIRSRKITYRYLIFRNYKIIYSVDQKNDVIKIADVFVTRQNPIKLERFK